MPTAKNKTKLWISLFQSFVSKFSMSKYLWKKYPTPTNRVCQTDRPTDSGTEKWSNKLQEKNSECWQWGNLQFSDFHFNYEFKIINAQNKQSLYKDISKYIFRKIFRNFVSVEKRFANWFSFRLFLTIVFTDEFLWH